MKRLATNKVYVLILICLAIGSNGQAQTASYNSNTVPIGGSFSSAFGFSCLLVNSGANNTAEGAYSLASNTTGFSNTSVGTSALRQNSTGSYNVATGQDALYYNNGSNNTATGYSALFACTTGSENIATGYNALYSNSTGGGNTAEGSEALTYNTTGSNNTAVGRQAMADNTTGGFNTAIGYLALSLNYTGNDNVAIGSSALRGNNGSHNVAVGRETGAGTSNNSGNANVFIGFGAGYNETGDNKLYLSNSYGNALIYGDFATHQVLLGKPNATGYTFQGARTLNVIGGIITDSMRVALSDTWADYVFAPGYKLRSINELEKYIQENKHLPNIPSAEDVNKNGVEIGNIATKLLEKIEELHLYVLQLQKQSNIQQKQIESQQKQIEQLLQLKENGK